MKQLALLLLLIPTLSFSQEQKVKNVILLIGDGMGLSQLSTVYYFNENKKSNFSRFRNIGLINTSSANKKITDSAAGATAFAAGTRSYNGAISVDTNGKDLSTLIEIIETKDIKSGIVATSSITHATPACFYAHAESRSQEEDIAQDLIQSGVDFFAGGGLRFFNRRTDGLNYYTELLKKGFILDTLSLNPNLAVKVARKYGFLLSQNGMKSKLDGRGDFLKNATDLALKYLSKWEEGFFLMVEGSQIDWEGHAVNAKGIIEEVKDFDMAIGEALDFASVDGNTLVIVTADHETGGFALTPAVKDGERDYNTIAPTFYSGSDTSSVSYAAHTATLIPVFAYGPQSEMFNGIYNNTEIFHKIMKATGWMEGYQTEKNKYKPNTFQRVLNPVDK
jgi:alkaline phosphatase